MWNTVCENKLQPPSIFVPILFGLLPNFMWEDSVVLFNEGLFLFFSLTL